MSGVVHVLDDDRDLAYSLARLLTSHGHKAVPFTSPTDLLSTLRSSAVDCLITDVMLGAANGFEIAKAARELDPAVSLVFITAWPRTADAVDAVRRLGSADYLEKPIDEPRFLSSVAEAINASRIKRGKQTALAALSQREQQVFNLLTRGFTNKMVANQLGISAKTVEDHRSSIMSKTRSQTLADLIALGH